MFTMNGKFNHAAIMIDSIEESTKEQIQTFLNHPAFAKSKIVIMPDCHAGKGAVVGFTMTMNDYILSNLVGVDISCGVSLYNLGKIEIDLEKLDNHIQQNIPHGANVNTNKIIIEKNKEILSEVYDDIIRLCIKLNIDSERVFASISSIGAGNHFVEGNKAPNGDIWISIHTGSRNFGLQIASYHQNKAKELMSKFFIAKDTYKDLEFLPMDMGGYEYLKDASIAQVFAHENRKAIANSIMSFLNVEPIDHFESVHNYINMDDKIIRKGAIQANQDQKVAIPLNMRDGVIIGTGKGNTKWNCSAPHGAGRLFSRKQAKLNINLEDYKASMEGIYTSCVNEDTLDESAFAYKDMNTIVDAIKETVDIDFIMKPIYNFKSNK